MKIFATKLVSFGFSNMPELNMEFVKIEVPDNLLVERDGIKSLNLINQDDFIFISRKLIAKITAMLQLLNKKEE